MYDVLELQDLKKGRWTQVGILLAVVITLVFGTGGSSPAIGQDQAPTVLITGSNRGIGFEFVRQYATKGWTVIATCRHPEAAEDLKTLAAQYPNITIERLDVLDHAMIDELAEKYESTPIDVLLSNAGIDGGDDNQIFGSINYDVFNDVMWTNALAPLKIAEAFIDHVAMSDQKKIMTVTSFMGSITRNRGGMYFYRSSKTAANQLLKTLATDVADRGIIVGMFNPGAIATGMTKDSKIPHPLLPPEVGVSGMIELINNFTPEMTGSFFQYTGEEIPW